MDSEKLLTVEEAANFLDFHKETLRRLVREGKVPAMKFGGRWRLSRQELESFGRRCANQYSHSDGGICDSEREPRQQEK